VGPLKLDSFVLQRTPVDILSLHFVPQGHSGGYELIEVSSTHKFGFFAYCGEHEVGAKPEGVGTIRLYFSEIRLLMQLLFCMPAVCVETFALLWLETKFYMQKDHNGCWIISWFS
jgi:hypothetical protein